MPLPMMSRSVRPVSLETSAQVRRRDHGRFHLGQVPFLIFGEFLVERLADDQVENRIAEEFHALVAVQPIVGNGGVGQRFLEKLRILELVARGLARHARGFQESRCTTRSSGGLKQAESCRRPSPHKIQRLRNGRIIPHDDGNAQPGPFGVSNLRLRLADTADVSSLAVGIGAKIGRGLAPAGYHQPIVTRLCHTL